MEAAPRRADDGGRGLAGAHRPNATGIGMCLCFACCFDESHHSMDDPFRPIPSSSTVVILSSALFGPGIPFLLFSLILVCCRICVLALLALLVFAFLGWDGKKNHKRPWILLLLLLLSFSIVRQTRTWKMGSGSILISGQKLLPFLTADSPKDAPFFPPSYIIITLSI